MIPAEEGQDRPLPRQQQRQRPRSSSSASSSSSHRSTSSGSRAQLPTGKREEPEILHGRIEAPIADIEPRQPALCPPQEKRRCVEFGRRDIPTVPSTPIASAAARPKGAAASVAHQATTQVATEIKKEKRVTKGEEVEQQPPPPPPKVKPPPKKPPVQPPEGPRSRSKGKNKITAKKDPPALPQNQRPDPPPLPQQQQVWFQNTDPPPIDPRAVPDKPKRDPARPGISHHLSRCSNKEQRKRQLKELPPALEALLLGSCTS